ncbi:MAG: hypothetical protein H8E44_07250 [Planctomycetes bacterium]|nr:hypothetical protein [Planctomycetota bacterium]
MAKKRAGWERMLYRGASGSTAATAIDANVRDINVNTGPEFNETTDRGAGTNLPKNTEQAVALNCELTFTMIYKDTDANMIALLASARTGSVLAYKVVRISGGETEFDGDGYIEFTSPGPLKGGMEVEFTVHPTDDGGRAWTVG